MLCRSETNNAMKSKVLVDALNAADVRIFPQKANPKKVTVSFLGEDANRYFITRVATNETDEQGNAKWIWAKGSQMRKQAEAEV
jgi:hypothetical protein